MRSRGTLRLAVACLLALSSLFCIAPLPAAFADPCYATNSHGTLTNGDRCTGNLDLTGQGVTAIAPGAFGNDTLLKTVNAPEATTIGESAFALTALTSVSLPLATSIGGAAFKGDTALTSVSLPLATSIGDSAFEGDTALTSISLPATQTIGQDAFNGDPALTSISLPLATSIGRSAFGYDTRLTSISLPVATSIGAVAFQYDTALTSISLPDAQTIVGEAFINDSALKTVNAPEATTIGESAFALTALTSVSLPDATSIGDSAFNNNTALTSVSLPLATSIGGAAFQYDTALTSVSLPLATSIGDTTFEYDTSLEYFEISDSVTGLRPNIFDGDSSLQFISYCGTSRYVINYADYPLGKYQGCSRGVIFNSNNGSGAISVETETGPSFSPKALTHHVFVNTVHKFIGWNTAPDGSGTAYADGAIYPFTSSVILYAQWNSPAPVVVPAPTTTVQAIAKCVSSKRTYIPLAKECLKGFTPVYK